LARKATVEFHSQHFFTVIKYKRHIFDVKIAVVVVNAPSLRTVAT